MNPVLKNINGYGLYNTSDIINNGWFYWLKGQPESVRRTVLRYLQEDLRKGENGILKPTLKGKGRASRWYIKGENIIKFVVQFEDGGLI